MEQGSAYLLAVFSGVIACCYKENREGVWGFLPHAGGDYMSDYSLCRLPLTPFFLLSFFFVLKKYQGQGGPGCFRSGPVKSHFSKGFLYCRKPRWYLRGQHTNDALCGELPSSPFFRGEGFVLGGNGGSIGGAFVSKLLTFGLPLEEFSYSCTVGR